MTARRKLAAALTATVALATGSFAAPVKLRLSDNGDFLVPLLARSLGYFAQEGLEVERVNEILELNKAGRMPATLELNELEEREPVSVLNSDLMQLDKKFSNKGGGRNKKKSKNRRRDGRKPGNPQGPPQGPR